MAMNKFVKPKPIIDSVSTPEQKEEANQSNVSTVEQISSMMNQGAMQKMDLKLYITDQIQKLLELYEKIDTDLPKESMPSSIKEAKFIVRSNRNITEDRVAEKIINNKRLLSTPSSYK